MKLPDAPPGWGVDKITDFIDNTRHNSFATYVNRRIEYSKLAEVDGIFRKLIDNFTNTKDWFTAFFVLRAHSAFLAGVHLAMSGQAAESYALLRLCIENGLYGLYISRNPESCETWLRRHDSEEAKRRVKDEFTIRNLFETLSGCDGNEATISKKLYDWCIDWGAHPNERALTQSLKRENGPGVVKFDIVYLSGDDLVLRNSLLTAAQVAASVLGMFKLVFTERFDITGLSGELIRARDGL